MVNENKMIKVLQRYWDNIERAKTDHIAEFWIDRYFVCKNYVEDVLGKRIVDKDNVIMIDEEEEE